MMIKRRPGKWVEYILTLAVLLVAVTPSTFNIPLALRPWVFLGSIVWIVVFSSGVFSS